MHAARCFVYKFSESETDSSTLMIIKQNFFNHLVTNSLKIVYFCKKSKIFVVKLARDYFAMLSFYYTTSIKKAGLLLVLENNNFDYYCCWPTHSNDRDGDKTNLIASSKQSIKLGFVLASGVNTLVAVLNLSGLLEGDAE